MKMKSLAVAIVLSLSCHLSGDASAVVSHDITPGIDNGIVSKVRPVFVWDYPNSDVTWVQLWINRDGKTHMTPWVERCGSCTAQTWTPPQDLPIGNYQFWMQCWAPATGSAGWSPAGSFKIDIPVPGVITLVSPSGLKEGTTHTYTWTVDPKATWHHLYVNRDGVKFLDQWFQTSETYTFSVNVNGHTAGGNYQWWVQGWSPGGFGPWSSSMAFSIDNGAPAAPALVSPHGSISEPKPEFKWNVASRAQWYRLFVNRGSTTVIDQWTQSTSLQPTSNLASGEYTWWVGAWNEASGQTVWSSSKTFSITGIAPSVPTLISPYGSGADSRPIFKWNAASKAEWYRLYVSGSSSGIIDQWTQATSFQPSAALPAGNYTWWVGAWNAVSDETVWSASKSFNIALADMEARAVALINQHRSSKGLPALVSKDVIAEQARNHSVNMATKAVAFSHDGFYDRVAAIRTQIAVSSAGENVVMMGGVPDPALEAFDAWINSPGHKANIEGDFNVTGMGAAKSADGTYYFTQIFARSP